MDIFVIQTNLRDRGGDWIQKADLQLAPNANPEYIALDETVVRLNIHQFRLYATIDPKTNNIPSYVCEVAGVKLSSSVVNRFGIKS